MLCVDNQPAKLCIIGNSLAIAKLLDCMYNRYVIKTLYLSKSEPSIICLYLNTLRSCLEFLASARNFNEIESEVTSQWGFNL